MQIYLVAGPMPVQLLQFKGIKRVGYIGGYDPDLKMLANWFIYSVDEDTATKMVEICKRNKIPYKLEE